MARRDGVSLGRYLVVLLTPSRIAQSSNIHSVGFLGSPDLLEPWSAPFDAEFEECLCSRLTKACKRDPLSALKPPKKSWPVYVCVCLCARAYAAGYTWGLHGVEYVEARSETGKYGERIVS